MKGAIKIALLFLTGIEIGAALLLFNLMEAQPMWMKLAALAAVVLVSLGIDAAVLNGSSAESVSDAKKLKDADDYLRAFKAWLNEETPFTEHIKIVIRQLESLKRKQAALRSVLDDTKDSPFLSTAAEVESYVLANCKRVLNRVMIYDSSEPQKYNMHVAYLQQVLGDNARVLSDFENLILEVSQIGDDSAAETPCLTELTAALRSVRQNGEEEWDEVMQQSSQPAPAPMPVPAPETRAVPMGGVMTAAQTFAQDDSAVQMQAPPREFIEWSQLSGRTLPFFREVRQLDGSYQLEPVPPPARGNFVLLQQQNGQLLIVPSPLQYRGNTPFSGGVAIISKFFTGAKRGGGPIRRVKPALFVPEPQRRNLYVCAESGEIEQ